MGRTHKMDPAVREVKAMQAVVATSLDFML